MSEDTTKGVRELVDAVYRSESRDVLAILIVLHPAVAKPLVDTSNVQQ
jgi:hypothetical protein